MRTSVAVAGVCVLAAPAAAQFPGPGGPPLNPAAVMPNIYNPATQPLSPYLNLLRGGNVGVNYFYGVRPGTVASGFGAFGGTPFLAAGGNRPPFFPQLMTAPDPTAGLLPAPEVVLPPAGRGAVFNNTLGFFPSPFGQAGGARSGVSGVGGTPRPAPKR